MKRIVSCILLFAFISSPSIGLAHPGKTDSNGGHYVRKSGQGFPVGSYHYHIDGDPTAYSTKPSTSKTPNKKTSTATKTVATPKHALVMVDGIPLFTDVPAEVSDGRTMVPLRPIFEALGATVEFDNKTGVIKGTKEDNVITLTIGSKMAKANGSAVTLDTAAKTVNGRTMVPARFIAESLGATVVWDQNSNTVHVASPKSL